MPILQSSVHAAQDDSEGTGESADAGQLAAAPAVCSGSAAALDRLPGHGAPGQPEQQEQQQLVPAVRALKPVLSDPGEKLMGWLYESKGTIRNRYPNLPVGLRLLQRVMKDYGCGERHLPFFDQNGQPTLVVHELNDRHHTQAVHQAALSVKKYGNMQELRGRGVGQRSNDRDGLPYKMIAYGTLSRGIYRAAKLWPREENVVLTLETGITIDTVDHRAPAEVLEFLRDFYNTFHGGIGISFLEVALSKS